MKSIGWPVRQFGGRQVKRADTRKSGRGRAPPPALVATWLTCGALRNAREPTLVAHAHRHRRACICQLARTKRAPRGAPAPATVCTLSTSSSSSKSSPARRLPRGGLLRQRRLCERAACAFSSGWTGRTVRHARRRLRRSAKPKYAQRAVLPKRGPASRRRGHRFARDQRVRVPCVALGAQRPRATRRVVDSIFQRARGRQPAWPAPPRAVG